MPLLFDQNRAQLAFDALDRRLETPVRLVLGGGTAMLLAHNHTVATTDVDAFPVRGTLESIDPMVKDVARELDLPPDWLNPWFTTFTFVLPSDYASRLIRVYEGTMLTVDALGAEDLLVMKCFAGRDKDRPHAMRLMKKADIDLVDAQLSDLISRGIPGAQKAADFFDDLRERLGV